MASEDRYAYIPPSVQKTMAQHLDRTMPSQLKKYQDGRYVPQHAEKAMSQHMQKNLPGHLKQYINPYLEQNVINPNTSTPTTAYKPSPLKPVGLAARVRGSSDAQDLFIADQQGQPAPVNPASPPGGSSNDDPYGFIMNPPKPPRRPMNFFTTGGNTLQKALVLGGGLIVIIILFSVASNFLNGASNAQKDRLVRLAAMQGEIVRVVDAASQKIDDKNLLYKAATVKVSMQSSQQDVIAAIAQRGEKVKDKSIRLVDPQNDATLSQGEQNGHYDQTYAQLLNQQLANYQKQLQAIYASGNASERTLANAANEQVSLLLGKSASQQ